MSTATATAGKPAGVLTVADLTLADRCDQCSAAAYAVASLPGGRVLLFCGHHGRANEAGLRKLPGARVEFHPTVAWNKTK